MQSKFVRYSRAGDAFHYRWAARRCLRLIDPQSPLQCITVESSKESKAAGEYAIDLAEYSATNARDKRTDYYQLKHSTVRTNKHVVFSEISPTIRAFAKRFATNLSSGTKGVPSASVAFWFVTNRCVNTQLKQGIKAIGNGLRTTPQLQRQMEAVTTLQGTQLRAFCKSFSIVDGAGDYIVQKQSLHGELAEYLAGFVDSDEVAKLINLVSERALPNTNGEIYREDVLKILGVPSVQRLFPCPQKYDPVVHPITREQHRDILQTVLETSTPLIIHAAGGVGKTIVAMQIQNSLPHGSLGIVYDCFGAGTYRSPSEPRHLASRALVQIANELAARGLCHTLIVQNGTPPDEIFRSFLQRLRQAVTSLRKVTRNAILVLLIDAADNAEMAASEYGDPCFGSALLREVLPRNCRLVYFCRSERINLLKPPSTVRRFPLRPFSVHETTAYLRLFYPNASHIDALEFHRLTSGNPRVQVNALMFLRRRTLQEVLASLGPSGTTVDAQIAGQLQSAVAAIKDQQPADYGSKADAICRGLANLPPFIPLQVLAAAAGVDVSTVKSFVSDLGRPLWLSDESVKFRDEPTETWFRQQFAATPTEITSYISLLEPLASKYAYVARTLPQLLLKAELFDRLLSLALSDRFLPKDPIDQRSVRVYRLQFAFKAALKLNRLSDAVRLAMRAGEEVAGDERQLKLLGENSDLIAPLQDAHRIQELGYRQLLKCDWQGSENLYSASLLSSVKDFHGEAQGYLRAAHKWLHIYFAERDKLNKRTEPQLKEDKLKDEDLVEFATAYHNLFGTRTVVGFLLNWKPPEVVFRVTRLFISRLVDAGKFDEIDQIALAGSKNPYLTIAIADELISVGRFAPKRSLARSLNLLIKPRTRIPKPTNYYADRITPAIVSFAEACAARKFPRKKIRALLDTYTYAVADTSIGRDYDQGVRKLFFRAAALRAVLCGLNNPAAGTLLPAAPTNPNQTKQDFDTDLQRLKPVIETLLPWYVARARLIACDPQAKRIDIDSIRKGSQAILSNRYSEHHSLGFEVSAAWFEVLVARTSTKPGELGAFVQDLTGPESRFQVPRALHACRAAVRLPHLTPLRDVLEQFCSSAIEAIGREGPEERARWFVDLARAVLPISQNDASAYFSKAIEAVSKFGDEMLDRWEAVVSLARRATTSGRATSELGYRFIRCAEMIGNTVDREKYWDRDEVFRVAVHLDPSGAFAALSRWRDRDVGYFPRQIEALAFEAVEAGVIAPLSGWCLSGFEKCNSSAEYAALCIRREKTKANQERILKTAIRDLELGNASSEAFHKLKNEAASFHLDYDGRLREALAKREQFERDTALHSGSLIPQNTHEDKAAPRSWNKLFRNLDLSSPEGLRSAVQLIHTAEPPRDFTAFWGEAIRRVPTGKELKFLNALKTVDRLDLYDIRLALQNVRTLWYRKAAVKKIWPELLEEFGRLYAVPLSNRYHLTYWLNMFPMEEVEVLAMKKGMLEGLSESTDLADASTFFGFASNMAERLSTTEVHSLLDYSLTRFEQHMEADFGDGKWAGWLSISSGIVDSMTGLIWSALGSPEFAMRWQAAHCVRRLAENFCDIEIASLIAWMQKGNVGAFGSAGFPFYELHARLYLLTGFSRAAREDPSPLVKHASVFSDIALTGMPHILIQTTAANIALSIERKQAGSYSTDILDRLRHIGISSFPPRMVHRYNAHFDTPWHARGEVDLGLKLHFGWDFDSYWFERLCSIFAVSVKQIIELSREAAVNYMHVPNQDHYTSDPRQNQWNVRNRYGHGGTYHSHGSYPHIDDYHFYYSYHALMSTAARLITGVPVIHEQEMPEECDRWGEWLGSHSLTRLDGSWLVDRRDPPPTPRRSWVYAKNRSESEWLWGINANDFLDCISCQTSLPESLCVDGHWTDCDNDLFETISISSALVTPETSAALASALRWCNTPMDFRLPSYLEDEAEFQNPPFELLGWIRRSHGSDKRLDEYDPYSHEIPFPPCEIGNTIASTLGLTPDEQRRDWRASGEARPSVSCEVWSDKTSMTGEHERPRRRGQRMSASIALLKRLCASLNKNLVFEVQITREKDRWYRSSVDEAYRYVIPSHKIFLFSSDGVLRDARESHRIG